VLHKRILVDVASPEVACCPPVFPPADHEKTIFPLLPFAWSATVTREL
jgi:hypothetical protein